ncbi:hypothetical protein DAT35_05815 [Vitiosangium sp. GDMCC 1.1324]|nr:hypothetical protein DAT35_05815 [Vitiosangium sp. GDMCC 1.1324]
MIVLLGLTVLAAPADATERAPLPTCEVGTRYIELTADAPGKAYEVCMRPELSISFFFDAKVARVELPGRQRFRVLEGEAGFGLLPVGEFRDGERVPVTVYFEDGAAPVSATFLLVVHPSRAERQVMVSRQTRTLASYRQGEQQARAEAQQCREENARLQSECSGQGGLTGLIAHEWMGDKGIVAQVITGNVTLRPGHVLDKRKVTSYRAVGPEGRGRVAVQVELFNLGTVAWTPAGAALVGARHEELAGLMVWPLEPIAPGRSGSITVELEAMKSEARGTFTLKLWGAESGAGGVVLDGVTFP